MAKKIATAWGERSKNGDSDVTTHDAVIRVYDHTGNVIETYERNGEFREPRILFISGTVLVRNQFHGFRFGAESWLGRRCVLATSNLLIPAGSPI